MDDSAFLILGANGQLGKALQAKYPNAKAADVVELDITDEAAVKNYDWSNVDVILNAAAYTNVPEAENTEGRVAAWQANAVAVKNLVTAANKHGLVLVHISTAYVFNGLQKTHSEEEPLSPLSNYGASKAAGDVAVGLAEKAYIIRTSAVVGDGHNFVRSIINLGRKGISPKVVADEIDRPTFTTELVGAIDHLLSKNLPYGIYNVSNSGNPVTWADFARAIYKEAGFNNLKVTDTTAADYFAGQLIADKRPQSGVLDLSKMEKTGYVFTDWQEALAKYVKKEIEE